MGTERRRRVGTATGLALFVALDAVLVVAALRPNDPAAGTSTVALAFPTVTATATSSAVAPAASPTPTGSSGPSAMPGPTTAEPFASRALPLAAASAAVLLRADPGSCASGNAALWRSTDGGHSWAAIEAPVGEIRRVAIESVDSMWVVGAEADCVPHFWRSRDGGQTWTKTEATTGAWYVPADARGGLHAPHDVVRDVCAVDPLMVAPAGLDGAAVACGDGVVQWSADAGQLWRSGASVKGLRALGLWSATSGLAVGDPVDGCVGLSARTTADAGATWQDAGCVDGVDAGELVGMAAADETHGVVVAGTGAGAATYVTTDRGAHWAVASGR